MLVDSLTAGNWIGRLSGRAGDRMTATPLAPSARAELSRDPVGGELNAGPPRAKAQLPPSTGGELCCPWPRRGCPIAG
jgi:hypothetical protein